MERIRPGTGMARLAAAAAMLAGKAIVAPRPAGPEPSPEPRQRFQAAREPNGSSFRSLRRAVASGWTPPTVTVKPERKLLYMNSHARAMEGLRQALARR